MTVKKIFKSHFTQERLKDNFSNHVVYSGATGIDNLNQYAFRSQLDNQIEIASRKSISGNYTFTKYKLKLVSKGRGKPPRDISIPTVRDRIVLRSLCNFLTEIYKDTVSFKLPQNIIRNVKLDYFSNNYNACIKLDIANFYPSILHKQMLARLGRKIRDNTIKQFIGSAIATPTVQISRSHDKKMTKGIPQGLAISNILAAIYLINIDKHMNSLDGVKTYRYVDDLLIFCDEKDAESISKNLIKKFKRIGLTVYDPIKNPEKSTIGSIQNGFDYLGYSFKNQSVTVRKGSIDKLKESIASIFTSYKYSKNKSEKFLLWRLNLRIAGCIHEDKSKGWLFFFSEINDESLLHCLDNYVKKLCQRFSVSIIPKKFVRAYKEISHRRYETNYIPNFDLYDLDKQKKLLMDYFNLDISNLQNEQILFEFKKRISKQVRELQVDIINLS